jgi:hypothetical protein
MAENYHQSDAAGNSSAPQHGRGGPKRAPSSESTAAARDDLSIELVGPKVLRVCVDPRNSPFSNQNGEGFENKLAEFFGTKLNKQLAYTSHPRAPGFAATRSPRSNVTSSSDTRRAPMWCRPPIPITEPPIR